jgi:hypothetical protein
LLDLEQGLGTRSQFQHIFAGLNHLNVVLNSDDLGLLVSLHTFLGYALALVVEQAMRVSDPRHSSQKDTTVHDN